MISQQIESPANPLAWGGTQDIDALAALGRFAGTPAEFWPLYLATLSQCLSVRRSLLLLLRHCGVIFLISSDVRG